MTACVTSVRQIGYIAENLGNKGLAGGYAPLDSSGLVPAISLPAITAVNGTTVPVNSAADQTVVTTAPATGVWTTLPSCPDIVGNHLNYNVAMHGFVCGSTGSSVGSVGFSGVGPGTNSNSLLVSGTLNFANGGLINANQLGGVTLSALPTGLLKITAGSGAPSAAGAADVTSTLGFSPENAGNKGASGGYAPLDANRLLPVANLPPVAAINGTSVPPNYAIDQTLVTVAPAQTS